MSADKRKRIWRAYDYLREINCGRYMPQTLSGRDLHKPVVKYIVKRGLAKIIRVPHWKRNVKDTFLDTGVKWAKPREDRW